jgi:hypothetical protein
MDPAAGPLTPERLGQWKQNFQDLVKQGSAAVPAIREFLEKNSDFVFDSHSAASLGYSSTRTAMFDLLQQIGGPEAIAGMTAVLGTSSDPREIAILARDLAQQDPEQYRGEVLSAVHEALTMAANKNLEGSDVGPLFEVLQKFGGPEAISELEQATGQWKYYATIALAQLPDGAGIPSLIGMAQDSSGKSSRDVALQMLTQVALQYPAAHDALLDQVRSDKIPARLWPYLSSPLAGDQLQVQDSVLNGAANLAQGSDLKTTHIANGNQNFISAPVAGLTVDQINQQIALVDELLAVTSNPAAVNALQQSKATLTKRLPQTAAVGGGK